MKTVIMAGGRGTRIANLFPDTPKPMIPLDGVPVLERELISLRDQGFYDITITVGYLSNQIIDYFQDGARLGIHIDYYIEKEPLGNAGALLRLNLKDDFLLLNGDTVFDIDIRRFVTYHREKGSLATILTHPNEHPYDSGLIIADKDNAVRSWLAKEDIRPQWYKNRVNAGLHILSPKIFEHFTSCLKLRNETEMPENTGNESCNRNKTDFKKKIDLDRDILKPLAGTGKLFCYDSPEYVKDMGTPERYRQVSEDFRRGIISSKKLTNKQKAIFLDRDGTINRYVGFLRDIRAFELLPGVSEAIRKINSSGYLAIVITNQPVVARGEVSIEELSLIHDKMETLLGKDGAYLDGIYVCPHHPDRGFEGEVPELKIDCDCRKPKPGLLFKAAQDFNIDLSESWMIGDSKIDVQAGKNAGCHTALIGTEDFQQDMTVDSLLRFVTKAFKGE